MKPSFVGIMIRRCFFLICSLLYLSRVNGQTPPTFDWATQFNDRVVNDLSVAAHPSGGVFLTYFSSSSNEFNVKKTGRDGELIWARKFQGNYKIASRGTCVTPAGDLYIAGISTTNKLAQSTNILSGKGRSFITKMSDAGEIQWVRLYGETSELSVAHIAVETSGSYVLAGSYHGAAQIAGTNLPRTAMNPTYAEGFFIAKFDDQGNPQWVRSSHEGSTNSYLMGGLQIDKSGNIFVYGYGDPGLRLEPIGVALNFQLTGVPAYPFLAKFAPDGALLWAQQAFDSTKPSSLAIDAEGNAILVAHRFENSRTLEVAKVNPAGALLWQASGSLGMTGHASGAGTDKDGNCYVIGSYNNVDGASFGDFTLQTIGANDMFLVKYTSAGSVRWVASSTATDSGSNCDTRNCVLTVDPAGGCYVAANSRGPVAFDSILLNGEVPSVVTLARLTDPDSPLVEPPVLQIRPADNQFQLVWPITAQGFVLEAAESPASSSWLMIENTPTVSGDVNVLTIRPDANARFFRLSNRPPQ